MSNDILMALPGSDNILKKQFANGVTVLVHENPWSSSAAVCGTLSAGSCLETPDKTGLASFVSASLIAGTQSRNFGQINEYLENIGAVLSFGSSTHAIKFTGKCLSEDLPNFLKLLKEVLDEPVFPDHYLGVLKQLVMGGYGLDSDELIPISYKSFKEILWGEDHPYGRVRFKSKEITRNINRDDLVKFHSRFFGPKNLIIALSGDYQGQEIMDCCESVFGNWQKAQEYVDEDELFPKVTGEDCCFRLHIDSAYQREVFLTMGTFGPGMNDADILPARLGTNILGEFGDSGRIGQIVRQENGLAYTAHAFLDTWEKGGCWSINAGTDPANLIKVGELIRDELRQFTKKPVSFQELEDAKSWYVSSLPMDYVNNSGTASMIHRLAYYQKDLDYFRRLPDRVNTVTPNSILETAQKWIDPEKLVIITSGPRDESQKGGLWWPSYYFQDGEEV